MRMLFSGPDGPRRPVRCPYLQDRRTCLADSRGGPAAYRNLLRCRIKMLECSQTREDVAVRQQIIWDDEPGGNIEHIEEHGLTVDDVEHVLASPESAGASRSTGRPCVFGTTPDGRPIIVIYEVVAADTIYPITAYEIPGP